MKPNEVIDALSAYAGKYEVNNLKCSRRTLSYYVSWGLISKPAEVINKGRDGGIIVNYPEGTPGEFFAAWNFMHGVYSPKLSREEIVETRQIVNDLKDNIFKKYIPETLTKLETSTFINKIKKEKVVILNVNRRVATWIINEVRLEQQLSPNKNLRVYFEESKITGEKRKTIEPYNDSVLNNNPYNVNIMDSGMLNILGFIDLDTNIKFISVF